MNIQKFISENPKDRIILALDNVLNLEQLELYVQQLASSVGYFKIGFQTIHSIGGPQAIEAVKRNGGKVFYDCKLHDTHDTMLKSAESIVKQKVDIFNIHASAGIKAMKSVSSVAGDSLVSAVSVLTSLSKEECISVYGSDTDYKVRKFASDIVEAGIPSIISSASEANQIKNNLLFSNLIVITPGIRPLWAEPNDQNPERIMTPKKAILAGADLLVIGRPILNSPKDSLAKGDTHEAIRLITEEIQEALNEKRNVSVH